jgi:hypothetical protein
MMPTSGRATAASLLVPDEASLFGVCRFFVMRLVEQSSVPLGFADRTFYGVFQRAATWVRCFQ